MEHNRTCCMTTLINSLLQRNIEIQKHNLNYPHCFLITKTTNKKQIRQRISREVSMKFLQQIDIFGLAVSFRINQERSYKTQLGGIVTLTIVGIILYQLTMLIYTVFRQTTLNVVQQQNYVQNQELFTITAKTFSFAFGLQDYYGSNFIDETIYTILVQQQTNTKHLNQTSGQYENIISFRNVSFSPCTVENFQIEEVQSYFLKLSYQQMYCIDPNESIAVQGEFSEVDFYQLKIQVFECTSAVGCADPAVRKTKLSNANFGIYTSDNLVQVTNRDKPYQTIGKNLFWQLLTMFEQEIMYNIINNQISTDTAYLGTSYKNERVISYHSTNQGFLDRVDSKMVTFYIVYEKNKQNEYYRKYLKFDQAFSQVGGTFNIFVAIGMLLVLPFSQLELNRKVINHIFDVESDEKSVSFSQKPLRDRQVDKSINLMLQQQIREKRSSTDEINQNKSNIQLSKNIDQSNSPSKGIRNSNDISKSTTTTKQTPILSSYSTSSKGNNKKKIKLTYKEYFLNYFKLCRKRRVSRSSELIEQGTNIIYDHIDIFNIIQKLLEIEKLKHLLLNEQQLMLFDYLPKPTLKFSEIVKQRELMEIGSQKRKKLNFSTSFVSKISPPLMPSSQVQQSYTSEKYFLITQKKTQERKRQDALKAYDMITFDQHKLSKIDQRLIEMVDRDFLQRHRKQYQHCITQEFQNNNQISALLNQNNLQSQLLKDGLQAYQSTTIKSPQLIPDNLTLNLIELEEKQNQAYKSDYPSAVTSMKNSLIKKFRNQNYIYTEEFETDDPIENPTSIMRYYSNKKSCNLSQIN